MLIGWWELSCFFQNYLHISQRRTYWHLLVRTLWCRVFPGIEQILHDFDNWMDHFACGGSRRKTMCRSLTISLRINSVLINKPCAFTYCVNCRHLCPNQKPGFTGEVHNLLRAQNAAIRVSDDERLRKPRANLSRGIRKKAKQQYAKRIAHNFRDSRDTRRLWWGIQTIMDYKPPSDFWQWHLFAEWTQQLLWSVQHHACTEDCTSYYDNQVLSLKYSIYLYF